MPYIITTKDPLTSRQRHAMEPASSTRRAVATLDQAIMFLHDEHGVLVIPAADNLPEKGGTVGPLPDGTVIEVKRVAWLNLARGVGLDCGNLCAVPNAEILDVYNAEGSNR